MKNIVNKHIRKLEKREHKLLNKKQGIIKGKINPIVDKIESKVPKKMKDTLNTAFYKAFQLVFKNGTKYIEKLYNKYKIQSNHNFNDYYMEKNRNGKAIKKMDKHAQKSKLINTSISAIEGAGFGIIGMGLPDIPLFTAMILKTIYEISLSYGYLYESDEERIYILNLICAALTEGEIQQKYNYKVDSISYKIDNNMIINYDIDKEILNTSNILSDSMLTSKFVQGIPVVGVVGSITNYNIINKISKYCTIKYKKRYLNKIK